MPFIMLAVLIDMMAIGLIIPVLPYLVGTFTTSKDDQVFWYGVVTLAFGGANFFGSPILGALSDAYGRRPVLLLGFAGLACSFWGTALADSLWVLVAVRLVSGAMHANVTVANAYVADISRPDERAKRFGLLGAMFGLGFLLGPVVGGILGDIDLRLPFFVAGVLALLNELYGFFVLPESLPLHQRSPMNWRKANPISAFRALQHVKGVGPLVVVVGLGSLAQSTLHATWVLYTALRFDWGPRENGWSLFAVGVMAVLVQGGLFRVALKYFSARRLAVWGLMSSSVSYALWGAATAGWMMYAIIGINVFGYMVQAAIQSLISRAAQDNEQGKTMGAVASVNSLMMVIAPLIGAAMLHSVSHLPPSDWRVGLPFFACSALQMVATVLAIQHFRRTSS